MADDAKDRREQQIFERVRLAEPGEDLERGREEIERGREEIERGREEIERGREEIERGREEIERGREEIERGREEIERGREEIERGMVLDALGPKLVAADIFRRVAGLGGHLVVAFVAPVGASGRRLHPRSGVQPSSSESESQSAAEADLAAVQAAAAEKIGHASKPIETSTARQPQTSVYKATTQAGAATPSQKTAKS